VRINGAGREQERVVGDKRMKLVQLLLVAAVPKRPNCTELISDVSAPKSVPVNVMTLTTVPLPVVGDTAVIVGTGTGVKVAVDKALACPPIVTMNCTAVFNVKSRPDTRQVNTPELTQTGVLQTDSVPEAPRVTTVTSVCTFPNSVPKIVTVVLAATLPTVGDTEVIVGGEEGVNTLVDAILL
jgi:hypothetical protein